MDGVYLDIAHRVEASSRSLETCERGKERKRENASPSAKPARARNILTIVCSE